VIECRTRTQLCLRHCCACHCRACHTHNTNEASLHGSLRLRSVRHTCPQAGFGIDEGEMSRFVKRVVNIFTEPYTRLSRSHRGEVSACSTVSLPLGDACVAADGFDC
jgi:hypothetical protein